MMRSCAHFGVKGVVVQDAALLESGAAIRTAEGGAEHVQPITGDNIVNVLDDFRQAGYTVVTTSSEQGETAVQNQSASENGTGAGSGI